MHTKLLPVILVALWSCSVTNAQWKQVYTQDFDSVDVNTETGQGPLTQWERASATGIVYDSKTDKVGRFLIPRHSWSSFNQGPIFNLDLTATPHDKVRVEFDLYTMGDWRGFQRATGGPHHRLMFFDSAANPRFAFDTSFATNPAFKQGWPDTNQASNKALTGALPITLDGQDRFKQVHKWPIKFEYVSDAPKLRFTCLCGAAAGSGKSMPPFGVDNVRVSVRSTAPTITVQPLTSETQKLPKPENSSHIPIELLVEAPGRTSVGIFDESGSRLYRTLLSGESLPSGEYTLHWDGRDNQGNPLKTGKYQWKRITTPGFKAMYITTLGINPPGGEHPIPRRSWVGDHVGPGTVDVTPNGIFIGSTMTEGMMMAVRVATDKSAVLWQREQFYEGGRLTRIASHDHSTYLLHPTGKLRKADALTGTIQATWNVAIEGEPPSDIDVNSKSICLSYPEHKKVVWIDPNNGKQVAEATVNGVRLVALPSLSAQTVLAVNGDNKLVRCAPGKAPIELATPPGVITALDYNINRQELWLLMDSHKVVLLGDKLHVKNTFGKKPRPLGIYDGSLLAGASDIAADRQGGFWITEPFNPPRRVAHFDSHGKLQTEWFGGMSFYISAAFDPEDPSIVYGVASEGYLHKYRIDFTTGKWTIEACYHMGRIGDGLYPNSGGFRVVRHGDDTYIYNRIVPAVLRLDPGTGTAVPVAVAGRVLNSGRTFVQFAGSGEGGYPKPWVKAARHHGFQDLATVPGLYSWADTNGDGKFDPSEFKFYDKARGVSFHNPGDFLQNGDYVGTTNVNEPQAIVHVPVGQMEGPNNDAPRWDWSKATLRGDISANAYGYGSPRGVSVSPSGNMHVTYQAGIMIHAHGQYEGGGWPEKAVRGSRLLSFDKNYRPLFVSGRQSKDPTEVNTGVLYYPMQTTFGRNRTIVVNDQTKQPAQIWSHDGLYLGSVFDQRADDGLDDRFYQVHGDDNQGVTITQTADGKTYWLMPYQAHNRLYEISGWDNWQRDSGHVQLRSESKPPIAEGKGLSVTYVQGGKTIISGQEDLIYYGKFSPERHGEKLKGFYKATWSGYITPPLSDAYKFTTILGANEQIAIWIDGKPVHTRVEGENIDASVELLANHRHRIRVEYINPDGRAELNVLWSSRVLDIGPIPVTYLHPDE
mgnify:FL=1|jgi:hypothetical protein|tara:strand:- start:266 stop:3730 length:3465 start_codon:yes stop_codon:yes gene_type:complete